MENNSAAFRLAWDHCSDSIIVSSIGGEIISANKQASILFGLPEAELCLLGIKGIMDPSDNRINIILEETKKEGKANGKLRFLRLNGKIFESAISSILFSGNSGNDSILFILRDTNELKSPEHETVKGNDLIEAVFSSLSDAIIVTDNKNNIIAYNDAFVRFSRLSRKEISNIPLDGFMKYFEVYDRENNLVSYEDSPAKRALSGISGSEEEFTLRNKETGETWFAKFNYSPVRNRLGKIIGSVISGADISEKKKIENELFVSAEKFKSIFSQSPVPMELYDQNARLLEINQAALDLFGIVNRDEVSGFYLYDDPNLPGEARILLMTGQQVNYDFEYDFDIVQDKKIYKTIKTGRYYFNCLINPWFNSHGKISGYLVHLLDITDRKLIESKLSHSLNHLNFHIENTPLATIEFGSNYEIIKWSRRAEDMFGWKAEEVIGKRIGDFKWVYEEDVKKVDTLSQDMIENTKTSNININKNYRKDGSVITCEWYNSAYIDPNGKLNSVYSLVHDITEVKRIEEELRNNDLVVKRSQEMAKVGSWELDHADKKLTWSEETFRVLGVEAGKFTPSYDKFIELIHPDDRHSVDELFKKSLENKNIPYQIEHRIYKKDSGELRYLFEKCIHQYNEKGNLTKSIGFVQDITERKIFELQIKENADELKSLNSMKDRLFSIIAHDLKSPFQALLGYSQFLDDNYKELAEEEKLEFIRRISNISNGTLRLLNNLLDWSRLQSDTIKFKPEPANIIEEIAQFIDIQINIARSKGINLKLEIEEKLSILVDRDMFETIMRNLISNAIKYSYSGGSITLSAVEENEFVKISVMDSGVGIKEDNLKKLFSFNNHFTTKGTNEEKGTGLGLLICKEMIEKNGGSIKVESAEGKGTTFSFTLPQSKVV